MKKIVILSILMIIGLYSLHADVGITFEFDNGEIIQENSEEYYSFDIMVYASEEGTRFGSGMVYVNYNTASFGQNIQAEENIAVEKGILIQGELTQGIPLYEIVNITDNSSSCVAITTSYDFPTLPDSANELPDEPIQYLHLTFKVVDNSSSAELSFNENLMCNQQYQSDEITIYNPVIAVDVDNTILPVSPSVQNTALQGILYVAPSPFSVNNSSYMQLSMTAPVSGKLQLNVLNIKGQFVKTIYDRNVHKGQAVSMTWDGKDDAARYLSSGVYFYNVIMNGKVHETKKFIIMK